MVITRSEFVECTLCGRKERYTAEIYKMEMKHPSETFFICWSCVLRLYKFLDPNREPYPIEKTPDNELPF